MAILTAKKGTHDFRPSLFPFPYFAKKRIYFKFWLFEDCWYDSLGVDNLDINKGPGVYDYWDFKKNENSLINGWRPKLDQRGFFEIFPYENVNGTNVANENKMRIIKADEAVYGYFQPSADGWELWLIDQDKKEILWHKSALKTSIFGKIDGWFGGDQITPHTMRMYLNFRN